jgi:magnesium transporter
MPHPLFAPEAHELLRDNDVRGMATLCEELHPATVAEILQDEFSVEDIWRFLNSTSIRHQAAIFAYFDPDFQVKLVRGGGQAHMARLIEQMSHDDRADLLRRLKPQAADNLMRLIDEADRRDIAALVKYPENTAGALMTTDYAWLPAGVTVEEALDRLRKQAPNSETIYWVYVVQGAVPETGIAPALTAATPAPHAAIHAPPERKLIGVVSLRDLILADRKALIRDVMETHVISARVTDDREKVAEDIRHYDLLAMPVVDANGNLVGIITADDALDVVVSEATEDAHRMGAVAPLAESYLEAPFFEVWRKRAVWLAALFLAEMLTYNAMAFFDDALKAVTVLALYVPLCLSTGGNSGSQAATLIIRAMALGQVTLRDWWRVVRHEVVMGLVLGVTLGLIAAVRVYFLTNLISPGVLENPGRAATPLDLLTLVLACAVACICLWGTLIGSILPLVFKRAGVDPGVASSPFVATFVDVTGIVIYFSIARTFLGHLM